MPRVTVAARRVRPLTVANVEVMEAMRRILPGGQVPEGSGERREATEVDPGRAAGRMSRRRGERLGTPGKGTAGDTKPGTGDMEGTMASTVLCGGGVVTWQPGSAATLTIGPLRLITRVPRRWSALGWGRSIH
jgi:hypothetical protein